MKKFTKNPRSFRTVMVLTLLGLIFGAFVYGLIRYFVLASETDSGVFQQEVLSVVLWEVLPAVILLCVFFVIFCIVLNYKVRIPVKEFSAEIEHFAEKTKNGRAQAVISVGKELSGLPPALSKLSLDVRILIEENRRKASAETDAVVRSEIARAIYDRSIPERIALGGLDFGVCARLRAAKNFGGDFCDAFAMDRNRVCIAIGDVWGKGVPAALFAQALKAALRERVFTCPTLSDAVNGINELLCKDNPDVCAATLFVGVFHPLTGELRYVNAGHLPPVVDGETPGFLQMKPGVVLGVYPDAKLEEGYVVLQPGQGLVLYTGGVTEARNAKGTFYDYDRLLRTERALFDCALGAEYIADGLLDSVTQFAEGAEQTDDMAVLVLYYPNGIQKMLRPEMSELETMRDLLFGWMKDDPRKNKIYLACEEIFTNIVRHSGASMVQMNCQREGANLVLRFTDDGEPFNPLSVKSEDRDLNEYGEGGMGMAIIRQIAGEIFYRTKGNHNVLTIRFPALQGLKG